MLADQQPAMLPQLGLTREFLEQQVERLARFSEIAELDPGQKAQADRAKWEAWLGGFSARLGKEEFGAAAAGAGWASAEERARRMDATNPKYILRNYIAENAIAAAEGGAPRRPRLFCLLHRVACGVPALS